MLNRKKCAVYAMICMVIIIAVLPVLSACGGVKESEFDVVQNEVSEYLADRAGNMKVSDLHMAIVDGDAPYIVNLRKPEDYTKSDLIRWLIVLIKLILMLRYMCTAIPGNHRLRLHLCYRC